MKTLLRKTDPKARIDVLLEMLTEQVADLKEQERHFVDRFEDQGEQVSSFLHFLSQQGEDLIMKYFKYCFETYRDDLAYNYLVYFEEIGIVSFDGLPEWESAKAQRKKIRKEP